MAHDAQIYDEPDFDPEELQSEYYRGLHRFDSRKGEVDSYKALHSWVPFIASVGGMMMRHADFQRSEKSAFGHEQCQQLPDHFHDRCGYLDGYVCICQKFETQRFG